MSGGAVRAAVIAAVGNLLQGWDNAAIAGSLLYLSPEFHLEDSPQVVGTIVAASLIGSVVSTFVAGPAADMIGRKSILIVAAFCYMLGAGVDGWSPSVNILIIGRSVIGFSIGLISTIVSLYIAECAPSEIRGQLATLPQLMGIIGMLLAYVMVFFVSLLENPQWRFMLSISLAPTFVYLVAGVFLLPESPRWLVSKGRMKPARNALIMLRGTEDVAAEMSMLVEGLGVGGEVAIEEWLLKPSDSMHLREDGVDPDSGKMTLLGREPGEVWVVEPILPEPEVEHVEVKDLAQEPEEKEPVMEPQNTIARTISQIRDTLPVNPIVSIMSEVQAVMDGPPLDPEHFAEGMPRDEEEGGGLLGERAPRPPYTALCSLRPLGL